MKKMKSVMSLVLAGLMLAAAPCANAEAVSALPGGDMSTYTGDADRDEKVTTEDALEVLRCVVGLKTPIVDSKTVYMTAEAGFEADADGNGKLSTDDALLILRGLVGLEEDHLLYVEPDMQKATVKKTVRNDYTPQKPVIIKTYEQYLAGAVYRAEGEEYEENFFNSNSLVCFVDPFNTAKKAKLSGMVSKGKNILIEYKHGEAAEAPSRDLVCVEVPKHLMFDEAEFCEVRLDEDYTNENGGMNRQAFETTVKNTGASQVNAKAIIRSKAELDAFLSEKAENADLENSLSGRYFGALTDKFFETSALLLSVDIGINGNLSMDSQVEGVEVNDKTATVTVRVAKKGESVPDARFSAQMVAFEIPKDKVADCTDYVVNHVPSEQQEG